MDEEILKRMEAQEKKLDEIHLSVEKIRKYFYWRTIFSVAIFVLPLIGIALAVPALINLFDTYTNAYSSLLK